MGWTHTVEIGYIGSSDDDEQRARGIIAAIEQPVEGDFPIWRVTFWDPSDPPDGFDTRAEAMRRTQVLLGESDDGWSDVVTVGIAGD